MSESTILVPGGGGSPFDRLRRVDEYGREYWSARDLQSVMGYEKWERFEGAVQRAIRALENAGTYSEQSISQIREMVPQGGPARIDYRLDRNAAYLVAMNGDPNKPQVAAAQAYFAGKTREAELAAGVKKPLTEIEVARQYLAALEREQEMAKELEVARPKAGRWDQFCNADGLIGMRSLADILGIDVRTLTGWLVEVGVFRRETPRSGGGRNLPRRAYQTSGHFTVKMESANGAFFSVAYATTKGCDLVAEMWENRKSA